jgi:hypothetical protein
MGTPSAEVPVAPAGEQKAPGVTLPPDRGWVAGGDVVGAAVVAGGRVVGGGVGGAVVVVARSVVAGRSVVVVELSSAATCSPSLSSGSPAITPMAQAR